MTTPRRALCALIVSLLAVLSATAQPADTTDLYWTTGIRLNNGRPYGILGPTIRIGTNFHQFIGADLGAREHAFGAITLLRLTKTAPLTLHALLGPQVEIILTEPTLKQTIAYLTATTGILAAYNHHDKITGFLAIQYITTSADIKPWKIGIGLLIPLAFK